MKKILEFLSQSSTIRGLVMLAGMFGYSIDIADPEAIVMGATGAIGLFETFRNGSKHKA